MGLLEREDKNAVQRPVCSLIFLNVFVKALGKKSNSNKKC